MRRRQADWRRGKTSDSLDSNKAQTSILVDIKLAKSDSSSNSVGGAGHIVLNWTFNRNKGLERSLGLCAHLRKEMIEHFCPWLCLWSGSLSMENMEIDFLACSLMLCCSLGFVIFHFPLLHFFFLVSSGGNIFPLFLHSPSNNIFIFHKISNWIVEGLMPVCGGNKL